MINKTTVNRIILDLMWTGAGVHIDRHSGMDLSLGGLITPRREEYVVEEQVIDEDEVAD